MACKSCKEKGTKCAETKALGKVTPGASSAPEKAQAWPWVVGALIGAGVIWRLSRK